MQRLQIFRTKASRDPVTKSGSPITAAGDVPCFGLLYCLYSILTNVTLENYGKTIEDSKKAIELNPKNIKAYFRAAKAYSALGKHTDAMEICELALKEEPNNKPIQEELKTAKDLLDAQRVRAKQV